MLRMALGTGQGGMFGFLGLQLLVGIGMATGADLIILVGRIRYLPRRMHRVAGHTVSGGHLYCRTVRFMTLGTLGNSAVFLRMAGWTSLLAVLTGLLLHACRHLTVT